VGIPRLDERLPVRPPAKHQKDGPIRICITTARTAFFNEAQYACVLRSLLDLKDVLARMEGKPDRKIEVIWRLPESLSEPARLQTSQKDTSGQELKEVLKSVDVFISTPSTTILEAMLAGVPTAVLEYNSNPVFVSGAWEIRNRDDLTRVMDELLEPLPARLWFQNYLLHDHLECRTPAMPRMRRLIEVMVAAGREARERNAPINLPARVLEDEFHGHGSIPGEYRVQDIYPHLDVWHSDVETQLRLAHIARENTALRDTINKQQAMIDELSRVSTAERFVMTRLRRVKAKLSPKKN
jgi:hypothetical protein